MLKPFSMLAAPLLACLAVAAPAGAATTPTPDVRSATFDVKLKGVEKTSAELHHIPEGGCDWAVDDFGSETYTFRSRKLRVRLIKIDDFLQLRTLDLKEPVLKLGGTLERTYEDNHGPIPVCSYGDGTGTGGPEPDPDCRKIDVKNEVSMGLLTTATDFLALSDSDDGSFKDPYVNCKRMVSDQYPAVMAFGDGGKRIGGRVSWKQLVGQKVTRVRASGSKDHTGPDTKGQTTIEWTMTLTKVKGPRRGY